MFTTPCIFIVFSLPVNSGCPSVHNHSHSLLTTHTISIILIRCATEATGCATEAHPGVQLRHPGVQLRQQGVQLRQPGVQLRHPGVQLRHPGVQLRQPGVQPLISSRDEVKQCRAIETGPHAPVSAQPPTITLVELIDPLLKTRSLQ